MSGYDASILTAQVVHELMRTLRGKGIIDAEEMGEILDTAKRTTRAKMGLEEDE